MDVCLGYWSALECWRTLRQCVDLSASYLEGQLIAAKGSFTFTSSGAELDRLREDYQLSRHIDGLVSRPDGWHRRDEVTLHVWSDGKVPCFVELRPDVHVACPAICFLQLSSRLDLLDCVRLGYELCSSYVPVGSRLRECAPLMTVADARTMIKGCLVGIDKRRALRALELVREGSRSPMESELAIKLSLPNMQGGYGLSGFEMNPALPLGEWGREVTGKSFCRPDLLWAKERIDIEYNGVDWHESEEQVQADLRRRRALEKEGYSVWIVDRVMIADREAMRDLADKVWLKVHGRRMRVRADGFEVANGKLFERFARSGAHVSALR